MAWTTLTEETALIADLEATGRVETDVLGTSVEGNPIRLLRIGDPPPAQGQRAALLLVGLQHGNEPAGREALLQFADYLSTTADMDELAFLAEWGVLIAPTLNPDNLDSGRNNANGVNLNRTWINYTQPETQALAPVLGATRPLVVVDHHESLAEIDPSNLVEFLGPLNPQVHSLITSASDDLITAMEARATTETWAHGTYGSPVGDDESLLHNNAGLRHSAGVLVETNRSDDTDPGQDERTAVQLAMAEEALAYAITNAGDLLDDTQGAAAAKAQEGQQGTAPFNLRETTLSPPPLAYQLSQSQQSTTSFHRGVFGIAIDGDGVVSMAQSAQPIIPFLLDGDAQRNVVSALRLFELEDDEPTDPSGLSQVATAQIRTRLTWLSCNLSDGAVITELPDLQGDEVSRVIGEYTSANLGLPIPAVGGRDLSLSQRAHLAVISTEPARTMIVPVVNDVPTAGFIPLTRDLGTDATVALGCVSLEGYLRHRYVRDHLWEGVDPAEIARGVLADAEDIDGNGQGINLIVDAPDVGLNAGRYFEAIDDETVYGALSELMDAGLIEWTIDVDWRDGMAYRVVDKIARVRLRLGLSGDPTAVFQSATFSSQGASDARYTLKGEFSGDRYGNYIVARGTGEGEDKPRSSAQIDQGALDGGAPIWEQRIQPDIYRSPLFTESQFNAYVQEQLLLHAQQELARIRRGGQTLEITARWDAPGARYGVDWVIGDDVLHELRGHAHPDGLHGVRRAIGFALSIQRGTIRPILQEEDA